MIMQQDKYTAQIPAPNNCPLNKAGAIDQQALISSLVERAYWVTMVMGFIALLIGLVAGYFLGISVYGN